jgi:hypothetical protein
MRDELRAALRQLRGCNSAPGGAEGSRSRLGERAVLQRAAWPGGEVRFSELTYTCPGGIARPWHHSYCSFHASGGRLQSPGGASRPRPSLSVAALGSQASRFDRVGSSAPRPVVRAHPPEDATPVEPDGSGQEAHHGVFCSLHSAGEPSADLVSHLQRLGLLGIRLVPIWHAGTIGTGSMALPDWAPVAQPILGTDDWAPGAGPGWGCFDVHAPSSRRRSRLPCEPSSSR